MVGGDTEAAGRAARSPLAPAFEEGPVVWSLMWLSTCWYISRAV